jgi:hypothetical protein
MLCKRSDETSEKAEGSGLRPKQVWKTFEVVVQPILELKLEEWRSLLVSFASSKQKEEQVRRRCSLVAHNKELGTCCWWLLLLVDRLQNVNLGDVGQGVDALRGVGW